MKRPISLGNGVTVGQGFGADPASYRIFNLADYLGSKIYLLYLDVTRLIDTPPLGKSSKGILKNLTGLSFSKPIQMYASISTLEFVLKVQWPIVSTHGLPRLNFLKFNSHTFKSIRSSFHQKSNGVPCERDGRSAPNLLINHSSQRIPLSGLPKYEQFLDGELRIAQARLLHRLEQYILVGFITSYSNSVGHILHIINRLYHLERTPQSA